MELSTREAGGYVIWETGLRWVVRLGIRISLVTEVLRCCVEVRVICESSDAVSFCALSSALGLIKHEEHQKREKSAYRWIYIY